LPTKCTEGHESLIRLRLAFFSCRFAPARRSMRRLGVSWAALVKQNYGLLTDYSLFADEQNAALPDLGCADTSASAIRTDSSLGELESGSAVTGSPRSKGDAHAFDLCSPRRSLAHRREAARNSVFATRLVLNMVPALQCLPPATLERSSWMGFPRIIDHRSLIIWPRPRAASQANWFGEKFANYAHIFPEYYV
jgi:hypothetical protein